jgi:hypothetical protein
VKKPKPAASAAVFGTQPKNGKKKKLGANMGGLFSGVTPKKPEPDNKIRAKQSSARIARLTNKLI